MTTKPSHWRIAHYHIEQKIGSGATSTVYSAIDLHTGEKLAVKVLHEALGTHTDIVDRFKREARLGVELDHPNVLRVVDAGQDGKLHYITMPLLDHISLGKKIDRDGPLDFEEALRLCEGILDGLEYIHRHGVLHRDLKAENILLDDEGCPYLSDFGLMLDPRAPRITKAGGLLVTPYYMPPEQWRGEELDERADIFAAGVMVYFMLTGDFPWHASNPAGVLEQLLSTPPNLDALPDSIRPVIQLALSLDATERFASASAFAHALESSQIKTPASPPPPYLDLNIAPSKRLEIMNKPTSTIPKAHDTTDPRKLAIHPVEIAEGSYWVGKRPPGEFFYANPYLRTFKGKDTEFNLIIDPGSSTDFGIVQAKSSRIIGSFERLSAVCINHQDLDVGSSAGVLLGRCSPESYILCSEDTWRLIQYYNIRRERFVALEKYPEGLSVPTGQWLRPVPSPFCHFVGAMMLYDPQTRVLYSGDLFGGLTDKKATGLFADESDWVGMRAFHQIYMPTRQALRHAIANIRAISEGVEIIAPQHGRLLKGDILEEFMRRLENLPVGLDIMGDRMASQDELIGWATVLERAISTAEGLCDHDLRALLLEDPNLRGLIQLRSNRLEITSMGKFVLERALRLFGDALDEDLLGMVKYEVVFATSELDLPTPSMELDEDGGVASSGSMLGNISGQS